MKASRLKQCLLELTREELEDMQAAGAEILDCYRQLGKAQTNLVAQCLANQGTFYEFDHYPKGDVIDGETCGQYFYHAHRPELGEHGHFHTFLRAGGMPRNCAPVPYEGQEVRPTGENAIAHLIAISMDRPGFPIALFTVNRWVTGETFYSAKDTIAMARKFHMDHTYPCLAVNRWITAMVRLFRPQISSLLHERDRTIDDWGKQHPDGDVFEDRDLVVTSIQSIDVAKQIALVNKTLARHQCAA
ncbi:MAG: hypothetical protein GY948_19785 [Alphaproteobacteria bacterium]|nr:hypothetical protein [Alphaproteobacteria bacterium]